MKIITKPKTIDKTLVKLMKKYECYYFATAWASLGSEASQELFNNKDRIKKIVVGTHFYQTHPDFIKQFIDSDTVNFILNTDGVYHPKVYLFSNSEREWECIIGSANFTFSALSKNDEIVIHIKQEDDTSNDVYKSIMNTVENYWESACPMNQDDYQNYKRIWNKNRKKIDSLKEKYGQAKTHKPLIKSNIFTLDWDEYFALIQKDEFHSFTGRVEILNIAHEYFEKKQHFLDMTIVERREIAGLATKSQTSSDIDWGWFGSMRGAGKFQNRINENDRFISQALDKIPMQGEVHREEYDNFIKLFKTAFPNGRDGIAMASRLLTMKRPDCFVCLNKKNRKGICEDFGIPKYAEDVYEHYWKDIIERIRDSIWYLSQRPIDEDQVKAWEGRVAMLDSMFFDENS